jgi:hypothetical protein
MSRIVILMSTAFLTLFTACASHNAEKVQSVLRLLGEVQMIGAHTKSSSDGNTIPKSDPTRPGGAPVPDGQNREEQSAETAFAETLCKYGLVEGLPVAVVTMRREYPSIYIILKVTNNPDIEKIKEVLGRENSIDQGDWVAGVDKPSWYNYGWLRFGVANSQVKLVWVDGENAPHFSSKINDEGLNPLIATIRDGAEEDMAKALRHRLDQCEALRGTRRGARSLSPYTNDYPELCRTIENRLTNKGLPEDTNTFKLLLAILEEEGDRLNHLTRRAKEIISAQTGPERFRVVDGDTGRLLSAIGSIHFNPQPDQSQWIFDEVYGSVVAIADKHNTMAPDRQAIDALRTIGLITRSKLIHDSYGSNEGWFPWGNKTLGIKHPEGDGKRWGYDLKCSSWSANEVGTLSADAPYTWIYHKDSLRAPDGFLVITSDNHPTGGVSIYTLSGLRAEVEVQRVIVTAHAAIVRASDLAVLWARSYSYTPSFAPSLQSWRDSGKVSYAGDYRSIGEQLDKELVELQVYPKLDSPRP